MADCDNCKYKMCWEYAEPCSSCTNMTGKPTNWKPQTNADHICVMTNEELAEKGKGEIKIMYDELIRNLHNESKYALPSQTRKALIEAADAIEELSQPRWIPVTERLPEEDGEYLTWFRVDDSEPSFGIFPFDANVPGFGYWDEYYDPVTYGWAGSDFIEVKGVTHWMPMPMLPKEETK